MSATQTTSAADLRQIMALLSQPAFSELTAGSLTVHLTRFALTCANEGISERRVRNAAERCASWPESWTAELLRLTSILAD